MISGAKNANSLGRIFQVLCAGVRPEGMEYTGRKHGICKTGGDNSRLNVMYANVTLLNFFVSN